MNKFILTVIHLVIAGGILIGCSSTKDTEATPTGESSAQNAIAPSPTPVNDHRDDAIRLAWFYKPPDEMEMDLVARNTDFFILTYKDEEQRDELKAKGISQPFTQYLLFLVINDPGDCEDEPFGNQVAYKPGDFCEISETHPDWFLLDKNGERISSRSDSYYMDPGNEGFRTFWLQRARELQETHGWDNIFLDNVEASRIKMVDDDKAPAKYPDDESYQKAVAGFLAFIRENYFEQKGKAIYGNIVSMQRDDENVWELYMEHLDGAMVESFATDWSDGYRSRKDWETQMELVETTLAQGKTLILVAQGREKDKELQNFAFASYLLITNENAYFRYTYHEQYRELWLYENYDLDIGTPVGERYKHKGGWRRDFTNGYVTVNPGKSEAEILINP